MGSRSGLGAEYRKLRAATPVPWGSTCPLGCGKPLQVGEPVDFDHAIPRALGGSRGPCRWAHASCNRSQGASMGNRLRAGKPPTRKWVERWR